MINYHVALHGPDWPTMQALQECIDRHGWPVKLGGKGHPQWSKPFAKARYTLGIPVVFKGEAIELEANFVTLGPGRPFAYSLDVAKQPSVEFGGGKAIEFPPHSKFDFKPREINETLASIGATDVRFDAGDRVLTLTFRLNTKEYQAGFYVMAALIKCFNGYGFQGHNHGASGYADALIAEAVERESGK